MKKAGTLSPEQVVQYDLLRCYPLSTPKPWVLPRVIGTRAKENQMQIAQEESEHQVNKKFNKSEKNDNTVGCQWAALGGLISWLACHADSMWVLGGHRIGPSHPNIHSVSSAHG